MSVLVDTSALLPLLSTSDPLRPPALAALDELRRTRTPLLTTSFVMHEATALIQARLGMRAVRELHTGIAPMLEVVWVEPAIYDRAVAALLAAGLRDVGLTDWTSFEIMRARGIGHAFAFDDDFVQQGFEVIPGDRARS